VAPGPIFTTLLQDGSPMTDEAANEGGNRRTGTGTYDFKILRRNVDRNPSTILLPWLLVVHSASCKWKSNPAHERAGRSRRSWGAISEIFISGNTLKSYFADRFWVDVARKPQITCK
jgi:hypothetical protein